MAGHDPGDPASAIAIRRLTIAPRFGAPSKGFASASSAIFTSAKRRQYRDRTSHREAAKSN